MGTITRSFANNITSGGTFDATDLTGTIPSSNIADASVTNITAVPSLVATTTVASDPPSPDAGQIWYNTTDKVLRAYIQSSTGSWSTGGNLNSARQGIEGAGTQTAAIGMGGEGGAPGGVLQSLTELYNGTSWTEVNDLNTARASGMSLGSQTSAIFANGGPPPAGISVCESWNGTSWTEVNDLNSSRVSGGGAGADNTSGLVFAGYEATPPQQVVVTESWNGTSWTEVNDLNNGRVSGSGAGTQTSALYFAGYNYSPNVVAFTESWNGTSWTEVGDMNTARTNTGGHGTDNT